MAIQELGFDLTIGDRIWIATALLHRQYPSRDSFLKDEIRKKLAEEHLDEGIKPGSISAHLSDHLVANVPASSGKYRMLFEVSPGKLRLFRPGDLTHPSRVQRRTPSKTVPEAAQIPTKYQPLIDWYRRWIEKNSKEAGNWQNDPLIRLVGSGRHIWADEHADQYVENLRREDI